jgi:hypothetical protein
MMMSTVVFRLCAIISEGVANINTKKMKAVSFIVA